MTFSPPTLDADLGEVDRGQGFLGVHARPQPDAFEHDVQLHPVHQAQRGHAVRRVQQQVKPVEAGNCPYDVYTQGGTLAAAALSASAPKQRHVFPPRLW